jgi:hypothetical protein
MLPPIDRERVRTLEVVLVVYLYSELEYSTLSLTLQLNTSSMKVIGPDLPSLLMPPSNPRRKEWASAGVSRWNPLTSSITPTASTAASEQPPQ